MIGVAFIHGVRFGSPYAISLLAIGNLEQRHSTRMESCVVYVKYIGYVECKSSMSMIRHTDAKTFRLDSGSLVIFGD